MTLKQATFPIALVLGLIAADAWSAPISFPSAEAVAASPDGLKEVIWKEAQQGQPHRLDLHFLGGRTVPVMTFERHCTVQWDPPGHHFAVTDSYASNESRILIFGVEDVGSSVPIPLQLTSTMDPPTGMDHHYLDVIDWTTRGLEVRVHGYGNRGEIAGGDIDQKLICRVSMEAVAKCIAEEVITQRALRDMIAKAGAQKTVLEIWDSQSMVTTVLNGISSANDEWLGVAKVLRSASDGEASESMDEALFAALPRKPYSVLPLMQRLFAESRGMCVFSDDSELPGGVANYVEALDRSLKASPPIGMENLRQKCLDGLATTRAALGSAKRERPPLELEAKRHASDLDEAAAKAATERAIREKTIGSKSPPP